MIGSVGVAALSLLAILPGTPPTDPPSPLQPGDTPERRLAEFSFAMFVTVELNADPGAFSCSEPDESAGDAITCFAFTGDDRVIIAVSASSNGTGVFEWDVVSDQAMGGGPAVTTTTTLPPVPPSTDAGGEVNIADSSIQSYGQGINRAATSTIEAYIESARGAILSISQYAWDPDSATLAMDVTLNPTNVINRDTAAWILVQEEKSHWIRGNPFRLQGATLRPAFVLVIGGRRYESGFDLMVEVADQLITADDWVAAARQG